MNQCRFCGSENTKEFLLSFNMHGRHIIDKDDKFKLRKCLSCDCIFVSGIEINKEYYDKYYEADYYSADKDDGFLIKTWSLIYKLLFNKKESIILGYFKNTKNKLSILDIGCGNGNFLISLDSKKFEKNGVEINPQGIKICEENGINIYKKSIECIDFVEKKFDIITLWHVMEHLENPQIIFEKLRKIIKDDGILIFQVPNNESMGFKFGKENWFHLDSPRHLAIPNKKTIEIICKKNGLRIIDIKNEFYDYPLDLLWSIRRHPIRFLMYPFYPLFKFFSKEHLTFVCKKIVK
jgi:2-polyprenyl-3-methyl-5-hydroxy-6-metoxy-1,4-benzoquinol methylase